MASICASGVETGTADFVETERAGNSTGFRSKAIPDSSSDCGAFDTGKEEGPETGIG